jgi:2-desacetyl-2-hydroxyethyl bacteriochlorophyllide A dehydrogenase
MQAALLCEIPAPALALEVVPSPVVEAEDELLVSVDACGICGTDLHIMGGESYRPNLPFVLGHEPVGRVIDAGASVRARWLGRRITITLFTGCGSCAECVHGDERICSNLRTISGVLGAWGGYAGLMTVHANQAVEVPTAMTDLEAACLVDGGATAANAVRVALEARPSRIAVVGGGPIGWVVAEMLRNLGLEPVVVHRSEPRRAQIKALGYRVEPMLATIEEAPEAVIDCAGDPRVTAESIEALTPHGQYVAAGYAIVPSFDLPQVARKELTIRGVRSGSRADLVHVLDLAASGRIRLPSIQTWSLGGINDALAALRERRVPGKAVIVPTDTDR